MMNFFSFKTMNVLFKLANLASVLRMTNFVLKMTNYALKMMNSASQNGECCIENDEFQACSLRPARLRTRLQPELIRGSLVRLPMKQCIIHNVIMKQASFTM